MKDIVDAYLRRYASEHRIRKRFYEIMLVLAICVAAIVYWRLKYTGIAMTNAVYCGMEEHRHTDECYEEILICTLDETGTDNTDNTAYDDNTANNDETVSGEAVFFDPVSTEGHIHTEECYEKVLICGKEEHAHTVECLTEKTDGETAEENSEITAESTVEATTDDLSTGGGSSADETEGNSAGETVETKAADNNEQYSALPELTGCGHVDFVETAKSQIGYSESQTDYVYSETESAYKGFTKYGEWYGNPYGDWDAMFVSYCLEHSGFSDDDLPENSGAFAWYAELDEDGLFLSAEDYTPVSGDIIFMYNLDSDKVDRVGIVSEINNEKITVIEGDYTVDNIDVVAENQYSFDDKIIAGFVQLPATENTSNLVFTAEDEGAAVTVIAPNGALSDNAQLSVNLYDEGSDEYAAAYELLKSDTAADDNTDGNTDTDDENQQEKNMSVIDISFTDNGKETEPSLPCDVSIDLSGILSEDADLSTVAVTHLEETENGIEPVLLADTSAETEGTIDTQSIEATFVVESFSDFTITWQSTGNNNRRTTSVDVNSYLYEYGKTTESISGNSSALSLSYGRTIDLTSSNETLAVSNFTLETASVVIVVDGTTYTYDDVTSMTVSETSVSSGSGWWVTYTYYYTYTITLSDGTTVSYYTGDVTVSGVTINLYYSEGGTVVEDYDGLSATSFKSSAYVCWDTFEESVSGNNTTYSSDGGDHIESVTLGGYDLTWGNASSTSSWSTSYTLGQCFPNANSSGTTDTATLTIVPETGYYVSRIRIGCATSGSRGSTPFSCMTLENNNGYDAYFEVGSSSTFTVDLSSMYFCHTNGGADYYFILIQVAAVASPLYVQYDYGTIVDHLCVTSGYGGAFDSPNGWTETAGGNVYGSSTRYTTGVQTAYTQYLYAYDTDPSDSDKWVHYTNNITDEAKAEAAAAGYYFGGWRTRYYTDIDVTSGGSSSYLYDENYTYSFSNVYTSTTYSEGASIGLPTHVKLTAIWIPITMTLTKTVTGLDGTEYESDTNSFTFLLQQSTDGGTTWTDYKTVTLSVTGDNTASTSVYPIAPGIYRLLETSGNDNLTSGSYTMYISVSDSGTVEITEDEIINNGANLSYSLGITNSYSKLPTANLPQTGSHGVIWLFVLMMITLGGITLVVVKGGNFSE